MDRAPPPKPLVFLFLLHKWVCIIGPCYCDETQMVLIKDMFIKKDYLLVIFFGYKFKKFKIFDILLKLDNLLCIKI